MESGFVDAHWPLLSSMAAVDHTKEHHPEGNVWRHTVEAFAYRKIRELPLSLGLLLHDCGKPFTGPRNGNAFDRHAQIGADKARRFMYGLGYSQELIDKVEYFVQNHMLPTYIPKIPFNRTEDVLASPLFPELLELYRCDVSSTFRGPEGYYNACAAYRSFLKNRRNPFRSTDGKKRLRLLVE
jgi:poly(A) polymerase